VFGAFPTGTDPQAQDVAFAVAVGAHGDVDRAIGDLPVSDLHVDRIDQHDR
jgi:hypothetical protein